MRYKSKKLTEEQVIEIENAKGSYRALSAKFNVSRQTIAAIKQAAGKPNQKVLPPSATTKFFRRIKRAFRYLFFGKRPRA